ncbi:2-oxoacid:acceptor oxidoreductase subunit alpha [Thermodesulfobacteriota bacterium]
MDELNIVLAGAAGQGVQSAASILGKTLKRLGFFVYVTQDYQSRVRGGHNFMRVRFSGRRLSAAVRASDFLLALNEESLSIHLPDLSAGGLAICMEESRGAADDPRLRALAADVGPTSARGPKFVGVKLLSALFTMIGLGPDVLRGAVDTQFSGRISSELLGVNLEAVDAVRSVVNAEDTHPIPFEPSDGGKRIFVDGNEAIALGLMAGGIGVYAGYPMTPATSIMNLLASAGPELGIAVEQVEDEIAALNLAVGASYAGARAAAGSSGAGLCLMSEALGLAGVTETPVLVIDGQRPGPAVGMATRTEQSDLLFAVHASQGEFPRAVIAPALHEDGFSMAAEGLNLAEQWQIPVILMSDQAFADAQCTLDAFDTDSIVIDRGPVAPEPPSTEVLRRYEVTDSGVSPRAFPVLSKWLVAVDSHEHDEVGHLTDNVENRLRQNRKRMKKLEGIARSLPGPELPQGDAETLVLCWGSTAGPVLEAVDRLRREGRDVGAAVFRYLFPMNADAVREALSVAGRLFTIEANETGQLGRLLKMETGIVPDRHIGKTDGRGFTVEDACALIETALGRAQ